MNYISDILFWISTGLLVPTVVLLVLFFVRALLLVGGFFGPLLSRRKADAQMDEVLNQLTAENVDTLLDKLPSTGLGTAAPFYHRLVAASTDAPLREPVLAEFDIAADADQNLPRTLAKMGPVLGLMGTLIPMGPALVGLSSGDIAGMAYNMQVVFATTVVGLVISLVGLITLQYKQRWYTRDVSILEYVSSLLLEAQAKK